MAEKYIKNLKKRPSEMRFKPFKFEGAYDLTYEKTLFLARW